ncbi:hypothetical protein [Desulfovibrio legallii]|uniref:hypothetical protein n=1 Tax=Desulfovibrio legallii TaxID=571438 RepID=UPI0011776FF2|nr:hypothetical protein [Desulfovibrio legallii]
MYKDKIGDRSGGGPRCCGEAGKEGAAKRGVTPGLARLPWRARNRHDGGKGNRRAQQRGQGEFPSISACILRQIFLFVDISLSGKSEKKRMTCGPVGAFAFRLFGITWGPVRNTHT